jgi:hypothetical protein
VEHSRTTSSQMTGIRKQASVKDASSRKSISLVIKPSQKLLFVERFAEADIDACTTNGGKVRLADIAGVFCASIWMQVQRMSARSPKCQMLRGEWMSAIARAA